MEKYQTEGIRNVVLLSHSGAGKTSLSEAMLFDSKLISRLGRVDDGTTTSDYDPDEVKRRGSINTSLLPLEWKQAKINLLDTPGYADFVGEVRAALSVTDGAVIVICAASGVEVGTESVWGYAAERQLPCLIFINKIDRENADFYRVLAELQAKFGRKCIPIQLPVGSQQSFQGAIDLITMKEIPSTLESEASTFREKLVEAIAETDDGLIAKYLEGEELSEDEIRRGLRLGTVSGKIVPVLTGSALQNKGASELLDAIHGLLPSPQERGKIVARNPITQGEESLGADEGGRLAVLVFKTTADPYVGKLAYLRVFSGTIKSDSTVWNSTRSRAERIGQLYVIRGKAQEPVSYLIAGDIGAVAKLTETGTNDSLSSQEHPLLLTPIQFPKPVLSVAVHPKTKADLDKLGTALAKLSEEDHTLSVRRDPDTAETILWGLGEAHFDVAAAKMKRKFGVEVNIEPPKIPYKETITIPVKAEYKHKKQTGGHGQYGHVFLELEPLPRGAGFEFSERIVGGVVPRNYIPAVEKGVYEARQEGELANCPLVDMKVTLYDGSYHPVDSSEMSFKIAAAHALRKGVSQGQPVLLEPIMNVQVTVPEGSTGDVIGDLNVKRARVLGMSPAGGLNVIEAQAPLAEMLHYATSLRSITQGRGSHTMEFSHYEEVPAHIAQKVIGESKKEKA